MKTYTLEELKLARAKKCRIEARDPLGVWFSFDTFTIDEIIKPGFFTALRIHPADEWKARLPRLKEGAEWHRKDFTNEMLEGGFRPLVLGEKWLIGDGVLRCVVGGSEWQVAAECDAINTRTSREHSHCRTTRPVPPEFLHPDELAKQTEAAQAPDFGEPWEVDYRNDCIQSRNGCKAVQPNDGERLVACVNNLAGVADPAEFVRQAKEMREAIEEAYNSIKNVSTIIGTTPRQDQALAKLKPFLP